MTILLPWVVESAAEVLAEALSGWFNG